MMRQLQRNLRAEATAVFNASGIATAVVAVRPGPSWELKQITVSTTVTATLTQCTTFVGTNNAGTQISQTLTGNFDTDSQPNTTAKNGESVCAVWVNGTPGRTARMTVIFDEVAY